jgi:hypothetical protein
MRDCESGVKRLCEMRENLLPWLQQVQEDRVM